MERRRRQKGRGSLHLRHDGYWVAQVEMPRVDGQRNRRTVTGKTFCDVLLGLSALRPPTPDRPVGDRHAMRAAAKELGTHTAREWYALCRAADNRCTYCRVKGRMTKDHDIPVTRGGSDAISNIVPACLDCNMQKHQLTGEEYRHWRTLAGLAFGSPVDEALAWAQSQGAKSA